MFGSSETLTSSLHHSRMTAIRFSCFPKFQTPPRINISIISHFVWYLPQRQWQIYPNISPKLLQVGLSCVIQSFDPQEWHRFLPNALCQVALWGAHQRPSASRHPGEPTWNAVCRPRSPWPSLEELAPPISAWEICNTNPLCPLWPPSLKGLNKLSRLGPASMCTVSECKL